MATVLIQCSALNSCRDYGVEVKVYKKQKISQRYQRNRSGLLKLYMCILFCTSSKNPMQNDCYLKYFFLYPALFGRNLLLFRKVAVQNLIRPSMETAKAPGECTHLFLLTQAHCISRKARWGKPAPLFILLYILLT